MPFLRVRGKLDDVRCNVLSHSGIFRFGQKLAHYAPDIDEPKILDEKGSADYQAGVRRIPYRV